MKRLTCLLLAAATVFALAVPASAAEFSDLPKTSQFYDYMQDLYNRGIFTGYSDGTIRPGATTTVAQALTLFARFYDLTDADKQYIYQDYGDKVRAIVPSGTATVYVNALSVCLAAGIVKESELRAYSSLNEKITREDMSVYLVRTMQLEDEAHSREYASLKFSDSEKISSDALFDIDLLVDLKIISGYPDGKFHPERTSTRQVVAKMISLSLTYLEENKISLVIPGYHNTARFEGILTAFDDASITVTGTDGLARRFARGTGSAVTVNGGTAALTSAHLGSFAAVTAQGNDLLTASVTYASGTEYIQGKISYLSSAALTGDYIAVLKSDGKTEPCTVAKTTVYSGADAKTAYDTLKEGQFVTVERKSGIATRVFVTESAKTLSGTVAAVNFAVEGGTLLVSDSAGAVWSFPISYDALPAVENAGLSESFTALAAGDRVTLSVDGLTIKKIARQSTMNEYTGKLTYVGQSTSATQWTLTLSDSSTVTLTVSPAAAVTSAQGGKLTLSSIQLGDTLTVTTADSVITKVIRTAQGGASGQPGATVSVEGTVLNVDTKTGTILALLGGQTPLTVTVGSAKLQNTNGTTVMLSSVKGGQTFLAYGAYSDTGVFAPTLIIFN